jgi:hypothetical protein
MNYHTTDNNWNKRMTKGMEMLQTGMTITENEDGSFSVPSQTHVNKFYEVSLLGSERLVCNCPDFQFRQIEACKHIHLVKFCLSIRYLKNEPKPRCLLMVLFHAINVVQSELYVMVCLRVSRYSNAKIVSINSVNPPC